jgi:serine/threonine protein kinase
VSSSAAPDIPGLVYVQPVGSGGYADVFLYEQQKPRMPVAVKVLKSEGLTQAIREQFTHEADTMAQLGDHPNIVQVFRADVASDGRPYLVMKYYPPPNLALRARNERFAVEEVLRTGIQLASAVETAHRAGITHRDIKPANVLISQYGAPGLTDFGIAGLGGRDDDETEDVGVSVPWAPPEVLFGQSNGDRRSDIYSLAATLWQLLVGRSPFEFPGGDNTAYALMPRIRSTPAPSTGRADVPTSLERLLAQAMSKDPLQRPATALEFARALQAVEQEQRFARTAIVVLDEQGQTTLVSQTGAASPGAAADSDLTRIKSPQRVHGQGVDELTRPRQLPPMGTSSPPLTAAPLPRVSSMSSPTRTPRMPVPDSRVEEGTVRSAPRLPVDQGSELLSTGEPAKSRNRMVAAGTLAAVALLGVVGFVITRGGGEADPGGTGTPVSTVSAPADDSALGDAVFDPPTLKAASHPGSVEFTWAYPGPDAKDTFRIKAAATVADAGATGSILVRTPRYESKAKAGAQICASVSVVRRGAQSPWSEPVCERSQ